MGRITEYRTDPTSANPDQAEQSDHVWMRETEACPPSCDLGAPAYEIGGMFKFWGGLTVWKPSAAATGLVDALTKITRKNNVTIAYGARALSLLADDEAVRAVKLSTTSARRRSELQMRRARVRRLPGRCKWPRAILGPGWELAKIRGTASTPATRSNHAKMGATDRQLVGPQQRVAWDPPNAPRKQAI